MWDSIKVKHGQSFTKRGSLKEGLEALGKDY
jgi:hypothetical protein